MNRMVWIIIACCIAVAPALASARQNNEGLHAVERAVSTQATVNACSEPEPDVAANPESLWRLRAYWQLDCAVGILDKALSAKTGDIVTLSREDAERVRALAVWAKDAAARIGR